MFSFIRKTSPLADGHHPASDSTPTSIRRMPQDEPLPSSNCVLLVDDEPHVLAVGKAVLAGQGFEVVCAASGELALELIQHARSRGSRYPVIVLDLTMPGGASGFEVLSQIQDLDPDVPVIACSGYFQEDARDLCRGIGFYDILQKPYNLDTLCTAVRRALVRAGNSPTPEPDFSSAPDAKQMSPVHYF